VTGKSSADAFTVAVLADIHGNLDALEAVLAELTTQSHDLVVVAGDLAQNGPQPAEALQRVRALQVPTLVGNVDREVVAAQPDASISWWTRTQIGEIGVTYLDGLPLTHRVTPPHGQTPGDDLLIMHATPTDCFPVLVLEPHPLGTTFTVKTPEAEAVALLGNVRANLMVYGHIHYASAGVVNGQRLSSIGSVGFPFDGDPRAAYALVTWDGRSWQVQHRRVAYDYEQTISAIERSGQPLAQRYMRMLREANWFPSDVAR